jgi:hypothetical protein
LEQEISSYKEEASKQRKVLELLWERRPWLIGSMQLDHLSTGERTRPVH